MRLELTLDKDDAKAINKAIAVAQSVRINNVCMLPDTESCLAGTAIGEICRQWLEARGQWEWDNGGGEC